MAIDPVTGLDDEQIGLGNAGTVDQAVGNFAVNNPAPPVDPAFPPEPTGFEPPAAAPPLPVDPALAAPASTPPDSLPSGLTGAPPAEALPPPPPSASVPTPNPATPPGYDASISPEDNSREAAKRGLDEKKAQIESDNAAAAADEAKRKAEEAQAAHVQFQADRQEAKDRLDAKTAAYEAANKLVDPRKNVSVKSRLAVIFSGLGSAMAGGPYKNDALENLQKSWDDDTERQKANIAALKDSVVMARTGLKDVDEGRRELQESADAKNLATYNAALKQGQSQLANLGMDQAAIDSDARIQALKSARAAAADKAAKDQDAHLLNQARINALNAQAAKTKAKGAGGGGGPISVLTQMKQDGATPADIQRKAEELRIKPKDYLPVIKDVEAGQKPGANPVDKEEATQIRGVDGEIFGHAPNIGGRLNPEIAHADTRVGNAKALIGAFQELRDDVAQNGNNLAPFTVKSRNRSALIANIQAAKRVAEALPASEGGLHLEEEQMPGSGQLFGLSTSPELIDKSIARIRDKVNEQNRAMVHDSAKQAAKTAPADAPKSEPAKAPAANVPASTKYTTAKAIVAPGSGATETQRKNAQAYLDSVGGR
jgi:hypothetical protein